MSSSIFGSVVWVLRQWASYQIRKIAGRACAGNAGNVFPRRRFQRKPLVSDPGMHHGTCVTHVPWCMSGSLTCGDGENVPGIPGACAPANLRIWQEAHVNVGAEHQEPAEVLSQLDDTSSPRFTRSTSVPTVAASCIRCESSDFFFEIALRFSLLIFVGALTKTIVSHKPCCCVTRGVRATKQDCRCKILWWTWYN